MNRFSATYSNNFATPFFGEKATHLGNVLNVITDRKIAIPTADLTKVDHYTAQVVSYSDYYPFGMQMPGRHGSSADYRYGFGGHEKDDEVSGEGNHLAFGDYGYDTRIGRRWNVDPEAARGPQYSPYSFAFNNPILYVDEDGRWAVYVHYKMTKKALMKAGISKQTAKEIAHYASTFADNPSGGVRFLNQVLGVAVGVNPFALSKNEKKYGSYDLDSQNDGLVKSVSIHAMKAYWEDISDDEAVNRALHGGEFDQKDENGIVTGTIVIEGALNVIERYKVVNEKDLTEVDKKEIGVAMHTIQDADAHLGGKWAQGKKHTEHAKEMGSPKRHSLFRDVFGNKSKSKDDSKKAAETLKGGS